MKKQLAIAAFITLTIGMPLAPAWSAGATEDAAQVKLQSASVPTLRQSAASAAGYGLKSIEIKHKTHQLTATIVNSKQNSATSGDREKEAIAMAAAMESGMQGKPEFEGVASIHIDYISRVGKKVMTIQIFDFFRSPANVFVLHKT
ncbi:MAG: hypothetical protein WAW73_17970 [Rhodoferax sp.]